jgi:hypothetical protein
MLPSLVSVLTSRAVTKLVLSANEKDSRPDFERHGLARPHGVRNILSAKLQRILVYELPADIHRAFLTVGCYLIGWTSLA